MDGLITIAKRFNLAFIIPHHFVKGVRSVGTVQAAIGGMGVIQNVPKSVFIFGPDSPGAKTTKALAAEKFNYGRPPVSLHFQLESWEEPHRGKMYEMSRLSYLGPIDAKAADIFDAAKYDARGTKRTGVEEASDLIIDCFRASQYQSRQDPNVKLVRVAVPGGRSAEGGRLVLQGHVRPRARRRRRPPHPGRRAGATARQRGAPVPARSQGLGLAGREPGRATAAPA
jgi:hypothetical protein